jgi:hypothetical protein
MDWWEEGFCEQLMAGSRFVIRYDHRDTGQIDQLRARGRTLFAARPGRGRRRPTRRLRPESAHLVGMSVGGWIGQLVALGPSRSGRITDPDLDEPHRRAKRSRPTEMSEELEPSSKKRPSSQTGRIGTL